MNPNRKWAGRNNFATKNRKSYEEEATLAETERLLEHGQLVEENWDWWTSQFLGNVSFVQNIPKSRIHHWIRIK